MKRTLLLFALLFGAGSLTAKEAIRLPNNPALSPDGKLLAFDWNGDIWTVPTSGGTAKPLTQNPAKDKQAKWSPDGKQIAFVSDREGSSQVFVVSSEGGSPKQVTFHTAGYNLHEWTADGKHLLVSSLRDHAWKHAERFFLVNPNERSVEQILFDDYGTSGTLSPDGKKLLFTREGVSWWRKGYRGSQSGQLWGFDLEAKQFVSLKKGQESYLWPMWNPKGGYYFASDKTGGPLNLWSKDASEKEVQLTSYSDDGVVFPCISRDGSTIVYRNLFDLYRIEPGKSMNPTKIELFRDDDRVSERMDRRTLERATAASFTADGLEIALVAGGDVWVMDTELREPKRITFTPEEERGCLFSNDGNSILFVSDQGGNTDIWKATRIDPKKPWFLNEKFKLERLTSDGLPKSDLSFSPDGSKLAYVSGRGDLMVADPDGKNPKKIVEGWSAPDYDWSPDGKWFVYAQFDNDFNRDIWVRPLDGSKPAFNISRHPYNEGNPTWSPDGRVIAFTGARERKDNVDIHFVFLREEDDDKTTRDKTLEKAIEKFNKANTPSFPFKKSSDDGEQTQPEPLPEPRVKGEEPGKKGPLVKKPVDVVIDFEGLHDRIRRVQIPNSTEGNLFWSPDSKKLAFTASIDGAPATYTIDIPDYLRPTQLSSQTGQGAKWLKSNQIVWLAGGVPGAISASGGAAPTTTPTTGLGGRLGGGTRTTPAPTTPATGGSPQGQPGNYRFTAFQDIDLAKRNQAAFDMCWRVMRDNWYDDHLGNRDWNLIRQKYFAAAETADLDGLTQIVQMMLGELNGSHLGFFGGSTTLPTRRGTGPTADEPGDRKWNNITGHLGIRFVEGFAGPGLKIRDILPEGPADTKKAGLKPGDVVMSIDGKPVDAKTDLTQVLNGLPNRDVVLKVKSGIATERDVILRPITFTQSRQLLYQAWLRDNRKMVEQLSKGTLGYLHIAAMDMSNFYKFEEELYNAGAGKDGLVIDVRENGGGSTADHLLTALTQPQHAIAIPRGGDRGYPQDRTVYATWNKPIIVLCNQNSFSNAEIFSHAIKTLKRGHLVGVPTAGGVISTGGTSIMDIGFLRLPFRGWYLVNTGEDMELHGAVPDVVVWPQPGEYSQGKDTQIDKAVEMLLKDVQDWKNRPQPKLKKATER
jgi:tricorn protease